MSKISLQKYLQAAGYDSRRRIRQAIGAGEFKVNGETITDPNFLLIPERSKIEHQGRTLALSIEKKCYFLLNKPTGVLSTLSDPRGRATISDLIRGIRERVYPVGRLDYHSEGLILLTNDGDFMKFIISAKNKIPKLYLVKIKGILSEDKRQRLLTRGIFLEGLRITPLSIDRVKSTEKGNSWLRITIVEGKKHIIRNLMKYSGHPVEKLKRLSIGTFRLKNLASGAWRELTEREVSDFMRRYKFSEKPVKEQPHRKPQSR